jgi:hypothetical protein
MPSCCADARGGLQHSKGKAQQHASSSHDEEKREKYAVGDAGHTRQPLAERAADSELCLMCNHSQCNPHPLSLTLFVSLAYIALQVADTLDPVRLRGGQRRIQSSDPLDLALSGASNATKSLIVNTVNKANNLKDTLMQNAQTTTNNKAASQVDFSVDTNGNKKVNIKHSPFQNDNDINVNVNVNKNTQAMANNKKGTVITKTGSTFGSHTASSIQTGKTHTCLVHVLAAILFHLTHHNLSRNKQSVVSINNKPDQKACQCSQHQQEKALDRLGCLVRSGGD